MVEIVLENLTKKFGEKTAVDNLNLKVEDEEFFVLLGPSGCGKTTTLNIIAGLEKATTGNIYFGTTLVNDVPTEKRDVAMVFQSYALYPHITVFDNIAFPLKIKRFPKSEFKRKVKEVSSLLRIDNLLNRMPYELSGGERQRVALARAIVREPKVFLLDEPLSNIDAKLRVYARAELSKLQKDLKITTIYVTHDQVEAMSMADRIAVMCEGKTMQVGDPSTIFEKPRNKFVADFVGMPPMNFFDCQVSKKADGLYLENDFMSICVPEEIAGFIGKHVTTPELMLGIRPHDMKILKVRSSEEDFKCKVYAIEPLGTETIVILEVRDSIIKVVTHGAPPVKLEEEAWVSMDKSRIHLFDMKTEKAIL